MKELNITDPVEHEIKADEFVNDVKTRYGGSMPLYVENETKELIEVFPRAISFFKETGLDDDQAIALLEWGSRVFDIQSADRYLVQVYLSENSRTFLSSVSKEIEELATQMGGETEYENIYEYEEEDEYAGYRYGASLRYSFSC